MTSVASRIISHLNHRASKAFKTFGDEPLSLNVMVEVASQKMHRWVMIYGNQRACGKQQSVGGIAKPEINWDKA